MQTKTRIDFLDVFRFLAILAVVFIHSTSQPVTLLSKDSAFYPFYFILNRGSQFAVPAFLFLSALVLFYRYYEGWDKETAAVFFRKRLIYIVVPYVIWSFFYFTALSLVNGGSLTDIGTFLNQLLTGNNYFHLYFVIVMIQFYALFPLLMLLIKRISFVRSHLIFTGVVLQSVYWLLNLTVLHIQRTASVAFTYLLFYLLGASAGIHFERFMRSLMRYRFYWLAAWMSLGIAAVYMEWPGAFHLPLAADWKSFIYDLRYYVYVSFSCVGLLIISKSVYDKGEQASLVSLLVSWGTASFAVYLIHPFVLFAWREFAVATTSPFQFHAATLLSVVMALIVPWLIDLFLRRRKFTWMLLGK
ncbi:acyltransferase [Ferviditalea candida]|uniref:Acyltransferase n=1 Tax=Ferviditalea candida TaxID=3108399 RepID=A0ABU5ZDG5_9BACL|nr:acyltransferase [Paenibacillaceae bacterium T2]